VQTRRTSLNHHHQERFVKSAERSGPEAELIALARSKGQILTEHTLRLIRDTLELVEWRLTISLQMFGRSSETISSTPSGFLIDRARRFHRLTRPAVAPPKSAQAAATAGARALASARDTSG